MTLSLEHNRKHQAAIRTSFDRMKPPTLYLHTFGKYARTILVWNKQFNRYEFEEMDQDYRTPLDLAIEMGWRFYQDSICPKCGVPAWFGRTTDNRVQFDIQESTCYSCAELEQNRAKHAKAKNPPPMYGVTEHCVPTGVEYEADGTSDPLPNPLELSWV